MITIKDLESLLAELPDEAVIRIASSGASTFFRKKGVKITATITAEWVQIRGFVGSSPTTLSLGGTIINSSRVDFIEATIPQ